ncbi:MAG: glycosyltransferase family 4 protein [Paludibacter sp.]|jgi:glycosyltransferase involved in cell wall biosynthesis|nr:glycosyltransferase family 4 protein [Paludibacter sp.]
MKKLVYISPEFFFDTDELVLSHLSRTYSVTWIALVPMAGQRRRERVEIENMAARAGVTLLLKEMSWRRRSWRQLVFDYRLLQEVKSLGADLLYVEELADFYFYLLQPCFLRNDHTVYALHDVVPHSTGKGMKVWLENTRFAFTRYLLMQFGRHFQLFSRTEYQKFRQLYPAKNAFFTRLMLRRFGDSTCTPGAVTDQCRLLFFGTIEYYKGLDLLIQVMEELLKEGHQRLSLTVAGKGAYWRECVQFVHHSDFYNLNIRFIPDEEIPDLFSSHHFLVQPYRDASQSGPQMIALQYALPVIASDTEGLSDFVVDGSTGFLFGQGDPQALKKVLLSCLTMSQNEYETMRNKLEHWTSVHCSEEETMERYLRFFNSLK